MRFYMLNTDRFKKAAKKLSRFFPELSLETCQFALARAIGYRDLHDLQVEHAKQPPSPLDGMLSAAERKIRLDIASARLAQSLSIPLQVATEIFPKLGLFGSSIDNIEDALSAYLRHLRQTSLPCTDILEAGAMIEINEDRFEGQFMWWRASSDPQDVTFVDHTTVEGKCLDYEARVADPETAFIPACLWLPYGWIEESDGAITFFSRDYLGLWRVSNGKVQLINPTTPLPNATKHWFSNNQEPWSRGAAKERALLALKNHEISTVPHLVKTLPILINSPDISIKMAAASLV